MSNRRVVQLIKASDRRIQSVQTLGEYLDSQQPKVSTETITITEWQQLWASKVREIRIVKEGK